MDNPVLFAQVKRKLNITWEDDETTARIEEIMESAKTDLLHLLGIADSNFDFAVPGAENQLFQNYCLYDWNHVLNEFEENYKLLLMRTKQKHAVAYYQANTEGANDEEDGIQQI